MKLKCRGLTVVRIFMTLSLCGFVLMASGCFEAMIMVISDSYKTRQEPKDFYIYENLHDKVYFSSLVFDKKDISVDVYFDKYSDINNSIESNYVSTIKSILTKANLFDTKFLEEEGEGPSDYKISFSIRLSHLPFLSFLSSFPLEIATASEYTNWFEHRFIITSKVYFRGSLLRDREYSRSYYSTTYRGIKPKPKFLNYTEMTLVRDCGDPVAMVGLEHFFDDLAIDLVKDFAVDECFSSPHSCMVE